MGHQKALITASIGEHLWPAVCVGAHAQAPAARLRTSDGLLSSPPPGALLGRWQAHAALPQQRTSRHPRTRPGTV